MLNSIHEAIAAAENILPGKVAPEGQEDPRWQAIMRIEDFVAEQPEEIWPFVVKWGRHVEEDLRWAIACLLLERLLEIHFALIFPRVEQEVSADPLFADTFLKCWKLGQAKSGKNSTRFDELRARLSSSS